MEKVHFSFCPFSHDHDNNYYNYDYCVGNYLSILVFFSSSQFRSNFEMHVSLQAMYMEQTEAYI